MTEYQTHIDPVTGCRVLTMHGFMESQADHNGTTVENEWERLWQDAAEIEKEELDRIMDPVYIIEALNSHIEHENKANAEYIERGEFDAAKQIKRIFWIDEDTAYGGGMFSGNEHLELRAEREDGFHGWLKYDYKYYAGSRLDPPDYALTILWNDGNGVEY